MEILEHCLYPLIQRDIFHTPLPKVTGVLRKRVRRFQVLVTMVVELGSLGIDVRALHAKLHAHVWKFQSLSLMSLEPLDESPMRQ
jgi:hypothetical protein